MQTVVVNQELVSWSRSYSGRKFHAALADFPYGYHFMSATWDDPKQITRSQVVRYLPSGQRMTTVPENIEFQNAVRQWGEAILPHLFPGALIFVFAGPRMWHRLASGMEDAGFTMWDTIMWLYGRGFPKGQDSRKMIDKRNGNGREVLGRNPNSRESSGWDGYRTPALKPAWEPILCFRAPRCGMTYAELALRYGTGALNIGGSRIGDDELPEAKAGQSRIGTFLRNNMVTPARKGRYPANLILDEESAIMMEAQKIGASRPFYCAKASPEERNAGCENLPLIISGMSGGAQAYGEGYDKGQGIGLNRVIGRYNDHPCVKPLALTRHLASLLLPPALVAPRRLWAPFAGSGSEMIGAMQAGWDEIVGIEQNPHYCEIARARLEHWRNLLPSAPARNDAA
jgi:hypothetical protein